MNFNTFSKYTHRNIIHLIGLRKFNVLKKVNFIYFLTIWNLFMKEGCLLVCLSRWNLPNHNASCHTFGTFGKPLKSRGSPTWFHKVIEYFSKNHLNQNYKWLGNLDAILVFMESPWWVGFNEGHLEFFRFEVQEILSFE